MIVKKFSDINYIPKLYKEWMDYLKEFVIGSSGLVVFQHLALLTLVDKDYYDYSYELYSIIAPLYYGLMTMLALFIGKSFGLSLRLRLFITSLISIFFVFCVNYFYSSWYYKPYKDYTGKEWMSYILKNGARHLVAFNIIIYFLSEYYSVSYPLRVFIIGSSAISYLMTYLKVMYFDSIGKVNYDYKMFTVFEPFIQGFDLLIYILFFNCFLQFSLITTLLIWCIFGSFLWLVLAYNLQTYQNESKKEWFNAFIRVLLTGFVKVVIFYYLITKLK